MSASCLAALVLASGCGGDDEKGDSKAGDAGGAAKTATEPAKSGPDTATQPAQAETTRTGKSPEDQPGGAGDEQPARAPAELTGRGGRIAPSRVRVPPFIAVLVQLRSGDGRSYGLRVGAKTLAVGRGHPSASTTVAGLRPGRRLTLQPAGGGSPVVVEATAEPGP